MNLPFLRFFKRDKNANSGGVAVAEPPIVPIEKPASERYSKTVRPNSSRIVALEPSPTVPVSAPAAGAPASAGPRKISLGGNGLGAVSVVSQMSGPSASGAERTIALQLADLVPHIPGGMLAPAEIDPNHRVLLKAADLELGMASGRPTVLLRAIYQQAPAFFTAEVNAEDKTEVALPFAKVLEQFAAFQVRPDQVCEEAVPQVETPFLKATLEDSKRFGTPAEPIPKAPAAETSTPAAEIAPEASVAPAPPPPPAPEVKAINPIKPIRLTLPSEEKPSASAAPAPIRVEAASAPTPSPAKISPNGTGVPASERVPASSGSPVPTPLPAPLVPTPPARVPFKVTPPSNDLREPIAVKLPPLTPAVEAAEVPSTSPRVRLPLRNVLRGLAPFQISGPIDEVPATAQIEFAFTIIEPQLSLGRIAVSPAQFLAALPEEFRSRFKLEDAETPVALPLQEVLQNLPNESLQLRGDQEEPEIAEIFETPFSKKAEEDAARFKVPMAPIAKPVVPPPAALAAEIADPGRAVTEPAPKPAQEIIAKVASNPPGSLIPANATPPGSPIPVPTVPKPDPKAIVTAVSQLPGVSACAVVFSDGLSLAGNIPAEFGLEPLCAMAPSLMKRLGDQMAGATLGSLEGLTLFGAKTPISFFAQGNICLAALHAGGELTGDTRLRLKTTAQELARIYAQPNLPNA